MGEGGRQGREAWAGGEDKEQGQVERAGWGSKDILLVETITLMLVFPSLRAALTKQKVISFSKTNPYLFVS